MTGNQLKILALIAMTVDHIGVVIFPQLTVLRVIGRLAYPIFAYMIAEGCFYTHDKKRYLGGIVALGTACQLVYFFALGSLEQSILSTFALSIVTVYAVQLADSRRDVRGTLALAGALALDAFVCWGLPSLLRPSDFSIDYGFWGVLLPVLSYLPRVLAARRQAQLPPRARCRLHGRRARARCPDGARGRHAMVGACHRSAAAALQRQARNVEDEAPLLHLLPCASRGHLRHFAAAVDAGVPGPVCPRSNLFLLG